MVQTESGLARIDGAYAKTLGPSRVGDYGPARGSNMNVALTDDLSNSRFGQIRAFVAAYDSLRYCARIVF